jgi:hypothetical protein
MMIGVAGRWLEGGGKKKHALLWYKVKDTRGVSFLFSVGVLAYQVTEKLLHWMFFPESSFSLNEERTQFLKFRLKMLKLHEETI